MVKMMKRKRFWELDFLRGICVLLMILDHFMFSAMAIIPLAGQLFGTPFWLGLAEFASDYWGWPLRVWTRVVVVCLFFVLCGISCTLSKSNRNRGCMAVLIAFGITWVTQLFGYVFESNFTIFFGVIHMLGCSMLIYSFIDWIIKICINTEKHPERHALLRCIIPAAIGLILLVVWAIFLGGIKNGSVYSKITGETSLITEIFFRVQNGRFTSISPADYWPMLPYLGVVLLGSIFGLFYQSEKKYSLSKLDGNWNKPVCFIGRHALAAYVLHQIVVALLFFAVGFLYSL